MCSSLSECLWVLCCRGCLHLPAARKSTERGQTICVLMIQGTLGSCAINWDAETELGEGRKLPQILSLGFLLLMEGSIVLVGVVWGCHGIPVVSVLQLCCMLEQRARWEYFKKVLATFLWLLSAAQNSHQGQVLSGSFSQGKYNQWAMAKPCDCYQMSSVVDEELILWHWMWKQMGRGCVELMITWVSLASTRVAAVKSGCTMWQVNICCLLPA